MTHTPGPWESNETGAAGDELACAVWTKAGYTPICTTDFRVGKYKPCTPREQHANARLIAAAPELLEALETIVNLPEEIACHSVKEYARSAIAKAKGEV